MTCHSFIKIAMVLGATATSIVALSTAAQAGDGCRGGFVWREAAPQDHVCVPPPSRDEARLDNQYASTRINEENHVYGPDTCIGGFVWREAFADDHVCVRPEIRAQSAQENALANSRVYVEPIPRVAPVRPVVIGQPGDVGPIYREPVPVDPVGVAPDYVEAAPVVVEPTYVYGGQTYDWVDNGWNGAGFYVAGLAFQVGSGYGGRGGFHGWQKPVTTGGRRNGTANPIQAGTQGGTTMQGGTRGGTQGGTGVAGGKGGTQGGGTTPISIAPVKGPVRNEYRPYTGSGSRPTFSQYGGRTGGSFGRQRYAGYSPSAYRPVRAVQTGGGFHGGFHGGGFHGGGFRATSPVRLSTPRFSAPRVSAPRITVARVSTPHFSAPHISAPRGGGRRR